MNKIFLNTAKQLLPTLHKTKVKLDLAADLTPGKPLIADFGNHYTGYFSLSLSFRGSPADAPALIRLKFCEHKSEIDEDTSNYQGWVSKSWIQEEIVHVDYLPQVLRLERRYAFRYVVIESLAASGKYQVIADSCEVVASTSAGKEVTPVGNSELEKRIDAIALRTLSECMQSEFEDGPKRDRRLWLGDLRLQALTNYSTFQNNDLVKRCLYLFAGTANGEGAVSACVFTKPKVVADDTYMFDYSLFFVSVLHDYYFHTKDRKTLEELLPTAEQQIKLAAKRFKDGVIEDSDVLGWCFLDWNLALNKQCGAQAVYIYALRQLIALRQELGLKSESYEADLKAKIEAGVNYFYDEAAGVFVSGASKQISYASNVWMVLAKVFDEKKNREILLRLKELGAVEIVTPYMYHHYVLALIESGLVEEARQTMDDYWGAMANDGADTFYELFNPSNPNESPYGGKAVLSYCHAWSCTPSYLLREYFKE